MRPGYVDPIEAVTAMQGELSDELALRSSIPVAEGVDGVQFPHVVRGAVAELLCSGSLEVAFCLEVSERAQPAGPDLLAEREIELARACDVYCALFRGPCVDILEDVTVDGLQVRDAELAPQGTMFQFRHAALGHIRFELRQSREIANIPKILKDVRFGVNVRVHIPGRRSGP